MFLNFTKWHEESVYEYEQRQLDIIVNNAIDAACLDMLKNTGQLDTDYIDWGAVQLDPKAGYNTYMALCLRGLGWADNEQNRKDLESDCIPFFLVAGYDGYYMNFKQPVESSYDWDNGITEYKAFEMLWTPKIPYTDYELSTDGTIYSYLLSNDYYIKTTNMNNNSTVSTDYVRKFGADANVNIRHKDTIISEILTKACNTGLFSGLKGNTTEQFYLPDAYTEFTETNVVNKPSIITYLTVDSGIPKHENYCFGVGGAKIDEVEFVLGYVRDGGKYYTDVDNRPIVEAFDDVSESSFRIMASPKEAALQGYSYDTLFLE